MPEFMKPVRKSVKVSDGFAELLGKELFEDLTEHEGICPQCHGTGMVIQDHPYGLEGDPDKRAGLFPYKHQSIIPCPNCYNGVVKYCPDCGKQLKRSYLKCDCAAEQRREREEKKRKYQEAIGKAEKHESDELYRFEYGYSDWVNHNDGFFSDWQEFFDAWHNFVWECKNDGLPVPERPEYVWGTEKIEMTLDAGGILENACEEMYDEAMLDISQDAIKEMQDYLNTWLYRYGLTTYAETHKHVIRIPWEEDKEYGE